MSGRDLPEPIVNERGDPFYTALVGRGAEGGLAIVFPLDDDDEAWLVSELFDPESLGILETLDARYAQLGGE